METILGANNAHPKLPEEISAHIYDIIKTLETEHPQKIRLIRKEYRALSIYENFTSVSIDALSTYYGIPNYIILELMSHLQHIWAIDWWVVEIDNAAILWIWMYAEDIDKAAYANTYVRSKQVPFTMWDDDKYVIHDFLVSLANTKIIQNIISHKVEQEQLPRWLLRTISLNDMQYSRFRNIWEYLEFILVNILEQDKILDEEYVGLLVKNWWIPVDDIPKLKYLQFSEDIWVKEIWKMKRNNQNIPIQLRIVPWYSPVGIDFMISLNLDWNNNNQSSVIWIQFESHEWCTVPVIHTIQQAVHNIWCQNDVLTSIVEADESDLAPSTKVKKKIDYLISQQYIDKDSIVSKLQEYISHNGIDAYVHGTMPHQTQQRYPIWMTHVSESQLETIANDIVMFNYDTWQILTCLAVAYLFAKWYSQVQIIDPQENWRLMNHNQNRSKKSLYASMYNSYTKKWLFMSWEELLNNRMSIDKHSYIRAEKEWWFISPNNIHISTLLGNINNMFWEYHWIKIDTFDPSSSMDKELFSYYASL